MALFTFIISCYTTLLLCYPIASLVARVVRKDKPKDMDPKDLDKQLRVYFLVFAAGWLINFAVSCRVLNVSWGEYAFTVVVIGAWASYGWFKSSK